MALRLRCCDLAATKIDAHLQSLALASFARILRAKTDESLERNAVFEADPVQTEV